MHSIARTTARLYFTGIVWIATLLATVVALSKVGAEVAAFAALGPTVVVVSAMCLALVPASAVAAVTWSLVSRTEHSSQA